MNEKQNWRYYLLGVMVVAAFLVAVYPIPELTLAARYTLAVFVLAAGMWIASPAEVLTPASLIVLVLVVLALAIDEGTRSTVPLLMFSGAGLFDTKDCTRFGLIFGIVVLLQWLLLGLPYWRFLGIM